MDVLENIEYMNIEWKQVLDDWREGEEKQWEPLYTQRGYDSWWEWRESYMKELHLADRTWTQEVVEDPHIYINRLHIGGYRGWHQYRPEGVEAATFEQVVMPPADNEKSYAVKARVNPRTNEKIMSLVGNLYDTTILVLKAGNFQVLLDGHHRSAAIAIEAMDGPISNIDLTIRICHFDKSELALLKTFAKDREIIIKKQHD